MKTLYIVRHAKSSWELSGLTDSERPLLEKGIEKTARVTDFLKIKDLSLDLIISSHAVRAYETAKLFAPAFSYDPKKIIVNDKVYEHSTDNLFEILYELDNSINNVMMVGHNPTFTYFANQFLKNPINWLPTSAIVCVHIDSDKWPDLSLAKKSTEFYVYPSLLKNNHLTS